MKVHFVIHESFEAPGAYLEWVQKRGHTASFSHLHGGDALPVDAGQHDMLVVMGGPQSPSTPQSECPHFNAKAEMALIGAFVDAGKLVVGVCLGAQLLGEALGGMHERSPEKEIGRFPITLTPAGRANPRFAGFADVLDVGHWHGDMPGLAPGATIIAYSEGCPRQIIEYSPRAYGFQCHMEFTADVVDMLIEASTQELATLRDHPFVQQADVLRAQDWSRMNQVLFGFLDMLEAEGTS